MKTKRYRTPKRKDYITYDDLEQLGFGSWLKDNAGNLIQGAAGTAMMFVPGGQVAGAGMLASSAGGFANTAIQNKEQEEAEKNAANQQALMNQKNKTAVGDALVSFVPTMKQGGRLKRMANGGVPEFTYSTTSSPQIFGFHQRPNNPPYEIPKPDPKKLDTLQEYKITNQEFATMESPAGRYHTFDIRRIDDSGKAYYDSKTVSDRDYSKFIEENSEVIGRNPKYKHLIKKAKGGSVTRNYTGQFHSGPDGGDPVDANGNINPINPVALVSKKEVGFNDYILSEDLGFADEARKLQKKYKLRMKDGKIRDSISSKGYDMEMEKLKAKQEELRDKMGLNESEQPMMSRGGGLPKYDGTNYSQYLFNAGNQLEGLNTGQLRSSYMQKPVLPDFNYTPKDFNAPIPASSSETTPYEGMSPWAAAIPSLVSMGSNLYQASRVDKDAPAKLNFAPQVAERISLEQDRQRLREQAALARTMNKRGLTNSGASQAQLMAGTTAGNIGVQRNLNEGLVQLGTTEALTNMQNRQQANQMNAEMDMQEQMYNSQIGAQSRNLKNQYITNAMTAPMLGMQDYLQSRGDAAKLQMSQPNVQLAWERDPRTGRRRLVKKEVNTGNILD